MHGANDAEIASIAPKFSQHPRLYSTSGEFERSKTREVNGEEFLLIHTSLADSATFNNLVATEAILTSFAPCASNHGFGYTYVGECGPLVGCAKHHEGEGGVILELKTAYKTQVGKFKSGAKFKSKFRKIELPPRRT